MRTPRTASTTQLTHRGRRLCALLNQVADRLNIDVMLAVDIESPILIDSRSADDDDRRRPMASEPALTCRASGCVPRIFVDPTGELVEALTATAPGSVVTHSGIGGTLVLRARRDVTRDLRTTASLVADLVAQTIGDVVSPTRSSLVGSGAHAAAGRRSDG